MTPQQFESGMSKLKSVYGEKQYPPERQDIIWRDIRGLEEIQWVKIVNDLIGECRNAPMLKEIREAAAKSRERFAEIQKENEARDISKFLLNSEEMRSILATARRAMDGEIPRAEFKEFIQGFELFVERLNPSKCKACVDTGIIKKRLKSTGTDCIFKCTCRSAEPFKFNAWPTWWPQWESL